MGKLAIGKPAAERVSHARTHDKSVSKQGVHHPRIVHESMHETCTYGADLAENMEGGFAEDLVK